MRSGWPTEDGRGTQPANQRNVPFGPEISWPTGYSNLEHPSGGYQYPATRAERAPAAGQGRHPYAAFTGSGYGDDGYSDPGYQGPAAQDSGIAGTRTVQGYVESGQGQQGYPPAGYAQSSYVPPAPAAPHRQPGYAGSSYAASDIELAYPTAASRSSDLYNQPWDYNQPLRYDGEEVSYLDDRGVESRGGWQHDGAQRYEQPAYDPAAYNGSDYSMPGISGPGYDLSGIIGTHDFEAVGYDEPSYGRLSYDDPRYDDAPRNPQSGQRFEETRFNQPQRFDETTLDSLWLAGEDVHREGGPTGYGNGGGADSRSRSGAPAVDRGRPARSAATRYDMKALAESGRNTRYDMKALTATGMNPRFDETRLDSMRALRTSGEVALAPPAAKPRNWAADTSLDEFADDHFMDLDLTDEPVPAAFTRTLVRPESRPFELPPGQDDGTATRRAVGKRRGRSGDRRQWMALGAIAVVAAGAIGGVLMKYVFSGPSGPAHTIVAPQTVDGFSRSANLEKQDNVAGEAQTFARQSGGQATDLAYGVYEQGGGSLTSGGSTQMFMFVGGKLTGSDPGASITNFEQKNPGATTLMPGSLGGQEACTQVTANGQSGSECVWFDNDTFGELFSPTMTTAKLATTMNAVRPSLELYAK